jgi:hypothetical protein
MSRKLNVRFGECHAGWIRLHIGDGSQEVTLWCSHFDDPLPKLFAWLEALISGLDRCGWTLNEENDRVELNAYVRTSTFNVRFEVRPLNDMKRDDMVPRRATLRFDLRLPDLVGCFYDAFVEFILSDCYCAVEWARDCSTIDPGLYIGLDWPQCRSATIEAWLNAHRISNGLQRSEPR